MSSKMHVVADMEINKFLQAFDTREEAVDYVRRLLKTNGDGYVGDLSLGRQTDEGRFVDVVTGNDLLALVREASTAHELVTAGGSTADSGSYGSHDSGHGYEAIAAKGSQ